MRLDEFRSAAERMWDEIPDRYKEGVDGLVVEPKALPHPTLRDIFTLGECRTEEWPSDFGGPDTLRSVLVLYHGSFTRLARLDSEFDWEEELWETITHELRHHLESLAAEDALEDLDYAADENFKRLDGQPFDPLFFRAAEPVEPGVWAIERDLFIEKALGAEAGEWIAFDVGRKRFRIPRPEHTGDVCFVTLTGEVPARGDAVLVLVRPTRLAETLRSLFRPRRPEVVETEARVERVHG